MNKKIKQIYDFVGNKILNVKVNTPTDNEHPTNKQYVDVNDTYDTSLSQKPVSTKFSWVTNLNGLKIKSVLDKLLFPVVNPVYENPTLEFFHFTFDKSNIWEDETIQGILFLTIKNFDRQEISNEKIIVEITDTQNNVSVYQNIDNTNKGNIRFNIKFDNLSTFKIKKQFGIATVKNNSDGNPFVDSNFNSNYTFEKVFTKEELISNIYSNVLPTIYHINNFDKNNIQTIIDKNISEYVKSSEFELITYDNSTPNINKYLCLVHPETVKHLFNFKGLTSDNYNITLGLMGTFDIYKQYDLNDEVYIKNVNGIDYQVISFDFGKNTSFRKYKLNLI